MPPAASRFRCRQNYDEAEREFATAIAPQPQPFEAHYFFARCLFQQGKHEKAVHHYLEAGRVRPEDYQTPYLVSAPLRRLGRKPEADAILRQAVKLAERHLELNPEDVRALYLGAAGMMEIGQREKALDWVGRALVLDPEDSGVLYNSACVVRPRRAPRGRHQAARQGDRQRLRAPGMAGERHRPRLTPRRSTV